MAVNILQQSSCKRSLGDPYREFIVQKELIKPLLSPQVMLYFIDQ